jgi:hypothetical protein
MRTTLEKINISQIGSNYVIKKKSKFYKKTKKKIKNKKKQGLKLKSQNIRGQL